MKIRKHKDRDSEVSADCNSISRVYCAFTVLIIIVQLSVHTTDWGYLNTKRKHYVGMCVYIHCGSIVLMNELLRILLLSQSMCVGVAICMAYYKHIYSRSQFMSNVHKINV